MQKPNKNEAGVLGGLRFLVVDYRIQTPALLINLLSDFGASVRLALGGHQAIQLLRQQTSDLVISNLDMPGMSGYDMAWNIREEYGASCPILIAHSDKEVNNKYCVAPVGFDDYIKMPFSIIDIIVTLKNIDPPKLNWIGSKFEETSSNKERFIEYIRRGSLARML